MLVEIVPDFFRDSLRKISLKGSGYNGHRFRYFTELSFQGKVDGIVAITRIELF